MLEAYGLSDPGCVRPNNEDYYLLVPRLDLYLVADGMGGAQAGEHASKLAVETVARRLNASDGFWIWKSPTWFIAITSADSRWPSDQKKRNEKSGSFTRFVTTICFARAVRCSVKDLSAFSAVRIARL